MEGDDEDILSAGIDHYLTKPVRKEALIDHIAAVAGDFVEDPFGDQGQEVGAAAAG